MSASTRVLESGASGGMTVEGWCVLAMGALFGLFLLSVWWELRRNLRSIGRESQQRERAVARLESKAAFERELERQAASQRMTALRAVSPEPEQAQVLAPSEEQPASSMIGLESVGRILERLAQAAPQIEDEVEAPAFGAFGAFGASARPALNMVRGGMEAGAPEDGGAAQVAQVAQVAARRSRSGVGGSRGKGRDGVKSSSIGSSAISSGALIASR